MQDRFGSYFPFRRDNRRRDGRWDAPLADRGDIRGTSVDPNEPLWPRWKKTPPLHHEGDFVSNEPFFDIDEITGKAEFYPPGMPLRDGNVNGNPARRQRVDDLPAGNSWRRRLLVQRGSGPSGFVQVGAQAKGPPAAQPGGAAEVDMEPPNFRRELRAPGFYYFTPTEWSWEIDSQGRPTPVRAGGRAYPSRDDWPPPNGDGLPDSYQPGSPSFNGRRIIRPKTS
jgi:hypothetical protein